MGSLSNYLDSNFRKFCVEKRNVLVQNILLQLDVRSSLLHQNFQFRNDFIRRPEVVATVNIGQLAAPAGHLFTALAEEQQLFRLQLITVFLRATKII